MVEADGTSPPASALEAYESSCEVCEQELSSVRHREISDARAACRVWRAKRSRVLPVMRSADADHQIHQHLEGESVSQARRQNIQPLVGITPETETNHQAHVQARRREAYLAGYTHSLRATGPNGKLLSNRALQTSDSSCEQSRAPPQAGTVPCLHSSSAGEITA
jgi:hypothetical protein